MPRKYIVTKEFCVKEAVDSSLNNEVYVEGATLSVKEQDGIEYVYDGCFRLAKITSPVLLAHGSIEERIF